MAATARGRGAGSPASAGAASSPSRRWGRGVPTPSTRRPPLRLRPRALPPAFRRSPHPGTARPGAAAHHRVRLDGGGRLVGGRRRAGAPGQRPGAALRPPSTSSRSSRARTARASSPSPSSRRRRGSSPPPSGQLHMVRPANVVELPYVSLSVPLPTPKVTPAPAHHRATRRAHIDAMSVTTSTRASPRARRRFRASDARNKQRSARTQQRSPKPATPTVRPARPARPRPAASPPRRTAATPTRSAPASRTGRRPRSSDCPSRGRAAAGPSGTFQRRVRLVRLVLIVAMLLLVARLVDVQVLHAGAYQAAARGESSISVSLPSLRGGIYARDGSPLALSVPTDDVVADDFQVAHPVQTALALAPILHVPATTLAAQLHRPSGYVVLARQLPQSTGQTDHGGRLPGHHPDRRLEAGRTQRESCRPGRRVHQRVRDTAPPDSSTGTTSCWREPTARRRSWSRLRVWRCHSRR